MTSNILNVLKNKMRETQEECDKFKEKAEDLKQKLQLEIIRREDEVAALNSRIQRLEQDLERSEERVASATQKWGEAENALISR